MFLLGFILPQLAWDYMQNLVKSVDDTVFIYKLKLIARSVHADRAGVVFTSCFVVDPGRKPRDPRYGRGRLPPHVPG